MTEKHHWSCLIDRVAVLHFVNWDIISPICLWGCQDPHTSISAKMTIAAFYGCFGSHRRHLGRRDVPPLPLG